MRMHRFLLCHTPSSLSSLLVVVLLVMSSSSLVVFSQVTIPPPPIQEYAGLPAMPDCFSHPLSPGVQQWNIDTQEHRIKWINMERVCFNHRTCYDSTVSDSENTYMVPQLPPLVLQQGDTLKLYSGSSRKIQPYKVNKEGFESCNVTAGIPVVPEPTIQEFTVQNLSPGLNYFIGVDSLFRCQLGLRLSVTVKAAYCSNPTSLMSLRCGAQGRCLAGWDQPEFRCSCCKGFTGDYCDNRDACASGPCQNGAKCLDASDDPTGLKYNCVCYEGFMGTNCDVRVDNLCTVGRCLNDGRCEGNSTSYHCHCAPGYQGTHCETDIDDCTPNPCIQGICSDRVNGYQCYCPPGRTGENCSIVSDACAENPCLHEGFCAAVPGASPDWECQCTQGYTGDRCQDKVNLCADHNCVHAIECVDYGNTRGCICKPGFYGTRCDHSLDVCASQPCQHGGQCIGGNGTYICECLDGYAGHDCKDIVIAKDLSWSPAVSVHQRLQVGTGAGTTDHTQLYNKLHNMKIVAATLGGAVVIALLVIVGCYCRYHGVKNVFPMNQFTHKPLNNSEQASVHSKEDRQQRINSITKPLPVEAIASRTEVAYSNSDTTMKDPLVTNTMKTDKV